MEPDLSPANMSEILSKLPSMRRIISSSSRSHAFSEHCPDAGKGVKIKRAGNLRGKTNLSSDFFNNNIDHISP
jgi:hypothetical protein